MSKGKKAQEKEQEEETRNILANAPAGPSTATGQELARLDGKEEERFENLESRGSMVEIEGGDIQPDSESPKPVGHQAEPARWTVNGSLPAAAVPTPTGPVPASALTRTVEEARKLEEVARDNARKSVKSRLGGYSALSEEEVARMSAADLRSLAVQRGYDVGEAGSRTTRMRFLQAQKGDKYLEEGGEGPEGRAEPAAVPSRATPLAAPGAGTPSDAYRTGSGGETE